MQHELANSVEVEMRAHGVKRVRLKTQRAGTLCSELPGLALNNKLVISRMKSADDSLQALFNSLLKIHRGES